MSAAPGTEARRPSAFTVHTSLIVVQISFATLSVVGKIALAYVTPFALSFARICGAALVLGTAELARRGLPRLPWRDHARIAGLAILGVVLNQLLFLSGLARTTATHATLLGSTIPAFTVVVGAVLSRERATVRSVAGVAVAFASVAWLVSGQRAPGEGSLGGDALILTNALSYALYLVLARGTLERVGAARVIALVFAYGTVFTLPVGAPDLVAAIPRLDLRGVELLVYLVLVATVLPYAANAFALRHAKSSLVAVYIYGQPILAALLAAWQLGERPTLRVILAGSGVLVGVGLASLRWGD